MVPVLVILLVWTAVAVVLSIPVGRLCAVRVTSKR